MKRLLLMIQFLTRLPVPFQLDVDESDFTKGVIWFPAVGMILGVLLFGAANLMIGKVDHLVLAVLLVFFEVLLTGGLHLDGLADSFDGLFSYRDKERMLEIMKDSRIGSNGVLILIFALFLKTALINVLLDMFFLKALLIMPALSRLMTVYLSYISIYARKEGMGNFFIGKTDLSQLLFAVTMTAAWIFLFLPVHATLIVALMALSWSWNKICSSKIGGMTGDTLGANTELMELVYLIAALFLLPH